MSLLTGIRELRSCTAATAAEAVGKHAHELLRSVFPAPIEEIRAELLRSRRWDGELQVRRNPGDSSQPMVVTARRAGATLFAILETNNDISDRERREREIRNAQRRTWQTNRRT